MVSALAAAGRDTAGAVAVDTVVGIEARGFILAAPVAHVLGVGHGAGPQTGKLPFGPDRPVTRSSTDEATIEVHDDAFTVGDRVLIVDDVLATGGTVEAAAGLVTGAGADMSWPSAC